MTASTTHGALSVPHDISHLAPTAMETTLSLDVVVTRGGCVESRHRVHAAVVSASGTLLAAAREPSLFAWWRSCAKPFQLLPMVADGDWDALGWGSDAMALACASHGSEPEHVAVAQQMLHDIGLAEHDLACGPHEPLSKRGAALLRESGERLSRLHSNCSGKHSAMLAAAQRKGWPTAGYEQEGHPVQLRAWRTVAQWSGVPADEIQRGVDGCGVTVFGLPLTGMAHAYARLATAVHDHTARVSAGGDTRASSGHASDVDDDTARQHDALGRIGAAMLAHPHLVGGTDRFDTVIMREGRGNIIAKLGAEGVHSVGILDRGIGLAVKVEDGAERAQYPAVLACLQSLGVLPATLSPALSAFAAPSVRNTRDEVVGHIFVPGHELLASESKR